MICHVLSVSEQAVLTLYSCSANDMLSLSIQWTYVKCYDVTGAE